MKNLNLMTLAEAQTRLHEVHMNNSKVVSIAKGLALGVLIPVAAAVIISRRLNGFAEELFSESLNKARAWEEPAEDRQPA